MFQGELEKRLDMLDGNLVCVSDSQIHLIEKREQGAADLTLNLQNPCILFQGLEDHKLGYFTNPKCADFALYEQNKDGWMLHIFELKRSVGEKEWGKMKLQFKGAIQNALAIAGFLDIKISLDRICVYSVYRNDKLKRFFNPVSLRFQMHEKEERTCPKDCQDWNGKGAILNFLGKDKFKHNKIPLNVEDGTGSYNLCEGGKR